METAWPNLTVFLPPILRNQVFLEHHAARKALLFGANLPCRASAISPFARYQERAAQTCELVVEVELMLGREVLAPLRQRQVAIDLALGHVEPRWRYPAYLLDDLPHVIHVHEV